VKLETSEGELEMDEESVVSIGDDGAYVMAWIFVSLRYEPEPEESPF